MSFRIALAGNPNCGKTTLFNALTGSSQRVGNWPGVTVEKKEGKYKANRELTITDLPGIYSLSPYTLEEVVARNYLIGERPDAVIDLVDATNIERNLYLTTQLLEMGVPVVVALNMMDIVKKNGDQIDTAKLSKSLGCPVVEISALKGTGLDALMNRAAEAAQSKKAPEIAHSFEEETEQAIAAITTAAGAAIPAEGKRWYAVKLFERDEKVMEQLKLSDGVKSQIETAVAAAEAALDDDAESIITNARYTYISSVVQKAVKKKAAALTVSDKIDRVITNRILALPIFVVTMFLIYAIAMGGWTVSIGTNLTDWANDGLFGDGWFIPFTADADAWEEDSGAFEEAAAVIEGVLDAANEAGIDTEALSAALEEGEEIDSALLDTFTAQLEGLTYEAVLEVEDEETGEVTMTTISAVTEVYFYDDENGVTDDVPVGIDDFLAALEVEEPDPAAYGTWVPGIPVLVENALNAIHCNEIVTGLILDGIIGGVGAVLGFVPQMLVLFLLLAILEDCGYMARIAFIMDRIFRRFGLSGKSFIPMLVATGCGVPGIMASRTIEQDRDRKMTIMTTGFMPCGAKMPIIALFAGALFGNSAWVAASAYFIGIAAIVISGIMLKKFKAFAGEPAPFVMELPAYHAPTVGNVLRAMWERGWSFIKRAGTVILISAIILWFLQGFGFGENGFGMVEDNDASLLAAIGGAICWIFAPLGFDSWQATVATITGLIAKEEVVGTMGVLYPGNFTREIAFAFSALSAYSFMIFNLLCAPCFAAMGAIKREMNNAKWTWAAIGYMCLFAYVIALIVYNIGLLFTGVFSVWTVVAFVLLAGIIFLLFRKGYKGEARRLRAVDAVGAVN